MQNNKQLAITILTLILGMFAFAYAAFPLYNLFCKVTGYGGTPKISEQYSTQIGSKIMTVRFNADIAHDLDWNFLPMQKEMKLATGENKLAFFSAENKSDQPITGMATYNVTPEVAGQYFHKIQCFCFDRQTLQANQKVQMPVSFYIDPAIEKDPDLKDTNTITLSYTFFKAKE